MSAPAATSTDHGRSRGLIFVALACACAVAAVGYVLWAVVRGDTPGRGTGATGAASAVAGPRATLGTGPQLLFRSLGDGDAYGRLALAAPGAPDEPAALTALRCDRAYIAARRGLCLGGRRNALGNPYSVATFGPDLQPHDLPDLRGVGIPSRVRVSPDGRYGAFTVFVVGHSYATVGFSTRTVLVDIERGAQLAELEEFAISRDGSRFQAADFNFWGVTFTRDSEHFYATLGTGGATYLIEGDIAARQARVLRDNVECPSLSPDNTRIAFKKQVGTGGRSQWRLAVLELATMRETLLAETANVDDQVEWLDDAQIAYAVPADPNEPTGVTDLRTVPADGSGSPHLLLPRAASPAITR